MNHEQYEDRYIADVLKSVKTIALVGASANPSRPSHGVMGFLLSKGYHIIPVNPGQAGKSILGQKVFARLSDISEPVDMVDVFRASEHLAEVVDETLVLPHLPKVIWTQLGVKDEAAAARAEEKGIRVIMDRCPAIEYPRLLGHHPVH